jgi:hypothetical protein
VEGTEKMRTLYDDFVNADIELSCYVRAKGETARIEVLYFADKNSVVRKILKTSMQKEIMHLDKGISED